MKGEISMMQEFVKWFEDLTIGDVPSVGGKNASLGEMIRNLSQKGVRVPSGFAITAYAYKYMIEKAGIDIKIKKILKDLNTHDVTDLAERGKKIRDLIKHTPIPKELEENIRRHYREMEFRYGENVDVAYEAVPLQKISQMQVLQDNKKLTSIFEVKTNL